MATHSSILAWRIPWTEEPDGDGPQGRTEPDTTEPLGTAHDGLVAMYHTFLVLWPRSPAQDLT